VEQILSFDTDDDDDDECCISLLRFVSLASARRLKKVVHTNR
jgi:hypothetical protein